MQGEYRLGVVLDMPFDHAVERVTEALRDQLLILFSDADLAVFTPGRLDRETTPCRLLGVCNPLMVQRVLEAEPSIGALLPWRVLVRMGEKRKVHVECMDPNVLLHWSDNKVVAELICETRQRLMHAMQALSRGNKSASHQGGNF
ncbi:MAG: DUF302 domain-containing protein [Betaproteobacteria bacterium]|nr:DUF302 domain-containing protein [Betaproteobacteria bacterium]